MALTVLDPNTALIVVDLQKGIVAMPLAHPIDGVIRKARALALAFRERGLPVVLVNVDGGAPGRTEQPRFAIAAASRAGPNSFPNWTGSPAISS